MAKLRVGNGYDIHVLVPDRPLILGGVNIPYSRGLLGNTDADALTHAIIDAISRSLPRRHWSSLSSRRLQRERRKKR